MTKFDWKKLDPRTMKTFDRITLKRAVWTAVLLLVCLVMVIFASLNPQWITDHYLPFAQVYAIVFGFLTSFLPFSLAEFLVYSVITGVLIYIAFSIWRGISAPRHLSRVLRSIVSVGLAVSIVYTVFLAAWGLCYQALPLSEQMGLNARPRTAAQLEEVTGYLVSKLNALSPKITRDEQGFPDLGGFEELSESINSGYNRSSNVFKIYSAPKGKVKPVKASQLMLKAGISGIYFPFTGEPNITPDMPQMDMPFTMAHELAHSMGIAREDEANFAAFLCCSDSRNENVKYSGYLMTFIHCYNALYAADPQAAADLWKSLNPEIIQDFQLRSDFYAQYQGRVQEISEKINDAYLKSMQQSDGVNSYGRMVDLVLAYYYDYLK